VNWVVFWKLDDTVCLLVPEYNTLEDGSHKFVYILVIKNTVLLKVLYKRHLMKFGMLFSTVTQH